MTSAPRGYIMTSASSGYVIPAVLCESYTALFICSSATSLALDVKCVINKELNKGNRTNYLHMALSQFCILMMNHCTMHTVMTEDCANDGITVPINVSTSDSKERGVQFFEELCSELLRHGENDCDDILYSVCHLSDNLIREHEIGEAKLKDLQSLYHSIFEFLCHYVPPPSWNTRYCQCETYARSGDCYCEIMDIN